MPVASLMFFVALVTAAGSGDMVTLDLQPGHAWLRGPESRVQIVLTGRDASGRLHDLTHAPSTAYESDDPTVATVDQDGVVFPRRDGKTWLTVRSGGLRARLEVSALGLARPRPVAFAGDVVPILTKLGCNGGMCHGKASGQNGFRLSLLGYDPVFDKASLTRDGRGRRVFPARPEASLLILKPTAAVPHGGGRRLAAGSPEHVTIVRWIGQGFDPPTEPEPPLLRISVWPAERVLAPGETQQLRLVAHKGDGTTADVTYLALYDTSAPDLATVDGSGRVEARDAVGEGAIVVRYRGQVAVARLLIPDSGEPPAWEPPFSDNLIDRFVFDKLRALNLAPAASCSDHEFARRAAMDICGVLPDPDEVAAFEADTRSDKRARWVDRLLERPEYADLFAMKWSALLRNQRTYGRVSQPGTQAFHAWIRQSIALNLPYDHFVAAILTARGDSKENPPVVWYRQVKTMEEQVDDTAQLFLGLRLQCARCHQHPSERWGPEDYYGFAAFFSRIGRKRGLDPITPSIAVLPEGQAEDPQTQRRYSPRLLGGNELPPFGRDDDPRNALADWLRSPQNPYFAEAIVNRYWKHFFGRGLVEPEDDLRVSNPPTHPDLLKALADKFRRGAFDLKSLIRTIASSRAYDRSSLPNSRDHGVAEHFGRFAPRRLPAEVLLDAIARVAGVSLAFEGLPRSVGAVQLPDEAFSSRFLDVFGRPRRDTACECERRNDSNLAQSLYLLSSTELQRLLESGGGRIDRWLADTGPDAAKVDELYRIALSRDPGLEERSACLDHLERCRAHGELRQGFEDLVWTLINTKEFLFNH